MTEILKKNGNIGGASSFDRDDVLPTPSAENISRYPTHFLETFAAAKLNYILQHYDSLPLPEESKKSDNKYDSRTILSKFYQSRKGNTITVKYEKSKASMGHGRWFAVRSLSLANIPRLIRNTIAGDFYYDIDMVNAHPTILSQYCAKHQIPCPVLNEYVRNRDAMLQELSDAMSWTKKYAKDRILAITNGATSLMTCEGPQGYEASETPEARILPRWVLEYKMEMIRIHDYVMKHEPDILHIAKKKNKKYNLSGSVLNLVICDIENDLLMAFFRFALKKGMINADIHNAVLVFDGIMLSRETVHSAIENFDMSTFLREASEYMYKETGYLITLVEKPMTERLSLPDDLSKYMDSPNILIRDDENESSVVFLKLLGDNIRSCDGVIFYKHEGVWTNHRDRVKRLLIDKCLGCGFTKYDEKKQAYVAYSSKLSNAKQIVEAAMCRVKDDPNFMEELWWSSKGKLVFADGWFDFATKQFHRGFEEIQSFIQIQRPFPERNEAMIQQVYDRVIHPILGEVATPFLEFLARAIAGHCEDKHWGVMMGERDCGKGVLGVLLYTAFEKYIVTISAESLLCEKIKMSCDEAKKLSWITPLQFSRLAVTNEIRILEGAQIQLDGNMIKKITSGGDLIQCRSLYENEKMIRLQATPLFACNDLPRVTPADAYETLVPFSCPNKFIKNLTLEIKERHPFYYEADPSIKDTLCRDVAAGNALFWIIVDHYKTTPVILPDTIQNFKNQFRVVDEISILLRYFHVTRDRSDYVKASDIPTFIRSLGLNMSPQRFASIMTRYGVVITNIRINTKPTRCYLGLKILDNEEE